jgi:hypothetical protein
MSRVNGQTAFAQRRRLKEQRCPVHGTYMSQIDGYWFTKDGIACPRKDCTVRATTRGADDEAFLLPTVNR